MFAITGNIQSNDQQYNPDMLDMLSWVQVAASSDVFEYAPHSNLLHAPVEGRSGFIRVPIEEARDDLIRSQKRLDHSRLFAYPLGQYNAQIVDMLHKNGVDLAFTNNKGYVNQNSNPLLLNRVTVYSNFDLSIFESIVTGRYRYR